MTARLKFRRRVACLTLLAMLPVPSFGEHFGGMAPAWAETIRTPARVGPVMREQVLPRPRPHSAAPTEEPEIGVDPIAQEVELPPGFRELAKRSGEPPIPGLAIVYLHPLGSPADAKHWRNIIVHQTEGPAGSAGSMALAQSKNPTKRGVTDRCRIRRQLSRRCKAADARTGASLVAAGAVPAGALRHFGREHLRP
jgi:hypothetical protein